MPFELNYKEKSDARSFYIIIDNPKTDWRQWIKTIGVIKNDRSPYIIDFRGDEYKFEVKENDKHIELKYDVSLAKKAPLFTKFLKNVFRKTACCIGCKECEADCHNGMLHMKNGNVIVDDGCMHCSQCHKVDKGCLVYKSLEMPKGGTRMGKTQSLNCFSHHAPKMEWMEQYFAFKNEFKEKNINISLPSLRIDSFALDIMSKVQDVKKSSLTFAPEAGTQRMRNVINKGLTKEDILNGSRLAFKAGWNKVKLYFMLGLPGETTDDIEGIMELCEEIAEEYYATVPKEERIGKCQITASTSFFVPKPFTAFQWSPMNTIPEFLDKAKIVNDKMKSMLNRKSLKYNWHEADVSVLEGLFARGDRKLSKRTRR